jgi:hypothetical protein
MYKNITLSDRGSTLQSERYVWRQAEKGSPLLQFAVSRGSRVLIQCMQIRNNILSLTVFDEDVGKL